MTLIGMIQQQVKKARRVGMFLLFGGVSTIPVGSAAVLFAIDKLPLFTKTLVAIKRTIIVAFPASFAATVVDSIGE